jgi:hypothetical protein
MIEHLRPGASAKSARVVLFDFDGTLSLIRSGWMEVMVPMMVEILADLKSGETEEELTAIVEEYVGRLTGKQTMYQMIALADEVGKRGGKPKDPLEYKKQYLDLLWERIKDRVAELERGDVRPEKYLHGRTPRKPAGAGPEDVPCERDGPGIYAPGGRTSGRRAVLQWRCLRSAGRLQKLLEGDPDPADHFIG